MKEAHKEVFATKWDLLLVDETHFGARAECYGKILQTKEETKELKLQMEQVDTLDDLDVVVKELHTKITIHLSGTPYRILMGSEFGAKDIIAFVQFSDIADAQKEWSDNHKFDDTVNEWDNPYFGFPQMIRFAFLPNQSSLDRLEQLRSEGNTTSFSELLRPESLTKRKGNHIKFIHEDVVVDLMLAIDGAKDDTNVLGFLDNERIKSGKLCRHIVMVLPYCASCDAMEELLTANADKFRNLQDYEIINISGLQKAKKRDIIETTKRRIAQCEVSGRKTITLTVNRMLTGSTVPQWDTMIYLKQTASPEEYDQAIYRLQNPYITEYAANDDEVPIKYNMKPQTILVDFDPDRMFRLQEHKCQIYNVNVDHNGNSELKRRIEKELEVSPIITLDHNKLRTVTSTNIIDAIRDYSQTKNVVDEAKEIAIDMSLLENEELRQAVSLLNPIDSRKGIIVPSVRRDDDDEGDDVNPQVDGNANHSDGKPANNEQDYVENNLAKQLSSYYALILFFAFLTNDEVSSLKDVIKSIGRSSANKRIATNLGLSADVLNIIQSHSNGFILSTLDYKIQNTNSLNHDENKSPMERVDIALAKFGRISSSEVVTPPDIADYMVSLLPESIGNSTERLLDIASKQAEFTTALILRFGNGIGDRIYSLCTSMVAYEFTRKVYELLMLPTRHVIHDFTSLDLIKEGNKDYIDYLKNMKFETIIGNPPYQEDGISTRKNPIYNLFYDKAFDISSKVMLITPGRFLYRVGQTPKRWMDDILSNKHIMVAKYYQKSSDVFGPSVEIKGGIAITYHDSDKDFGEIGFFSEYPELRSTIKKVYKHKDFRSGEFSSLISSQGIYKFSEEVFREYPKIIEVQGRGTAAKITSNSFENLPEIFLKDEPINKSDYILMIGRINNRRVYRWIKRVYIQQEETIKYYRVLITEANGTGAIGEALSTPIIAEPQTGHTDTFLSIGKFDNAEEAKNCLKYIKTKFLRAMLATLKATQHNPKDCWKNIPLQDFSTNSDIDWSMDIKEIDNKLYEKYGLDEEEKIFINTKIKSM
jgi:thiol-disulfide isomerase/thioredoxin